MEEKFNCTGCGACCRLIGHIVFSARYRVEMGERDGVLLEAANFPYDVKGDGSCSMLDEENKCRVYEDRPDICKVSRMYEKYNTHKTRSEYYAENEEACVVLQKVMENEGK